MSPKRPLLESFVRAIEALDHYSPLYAAKLRELFAVVGKRRPDLLERYQFAERGERSVEIERILNEVLSEVHLLDREGKLHKDSGVPYFGSLRFNHATRSLHLGHSRGVALFPRS